MNSKDQEKKLIEPIMSRDVAIQELNKWFDVLQVPESDRIDIEEEEKEKSDVMREKVLKAFMNGRLTQNEKGELVYKLKYPLKKQDSEEIVLDKLTFRLRYRAFELESNMKGMKSAEIMPMTRAYIATLTNVSKSLIGKMYNVDNEIAQAIYLLFTRGDA